MANKLQKLENTIFFGEHSDDEWKEIEKEVERELLNASEKDKQQFLESGASQLLTQIMEYID